MKKNIPHKFSWKQMIGHVLAWVLYGYASVWYHPPEVPATVILWMFALYIPVFYSLVFLFRGLLSKEKRIVFIMYTVGGLMLCYLVTLNFIYAILPVLGVYIFNPDIPFTYGAFMEDVTLALLQWIIYAGIFVLVESWWKLARLKRDNRKALRRLELQALGKELTAHTQFGLLQHLQGSSLEGKVEMQDYAVELAAVFDYQLQATQKNLVALQDELKEVSRVANMLKPMYFVNDPEWLQMKVTSSTSPEEVMARPVPPLVLVGLLENACKYGDLSSAGNLRLELMGSENDLIIKCVNKIGKAQPWISTGGIGLRNLIRRLELLFPGNAWMETEREKDYFYTTLKIRYHEKM